MRERTADDGGTTALLLILGLLVAVSVGLATHGAALADALLALARGLLVPLAAVSEEHAAALARLRALEPGTRDPGFAWEVLGAVCRPWSVAVGLPLAALIVLKGAKASVRDVHRRLLDMEGLLRVSRRLAPCVAPVLNWPRSLLDEPMDSGPWRVAVQPLQYAAEHGLLVAPARPGAPDTGVPVVIRPDEVLDEYGIARGDSPWLNLRHGGPKLDRERARALFAAQLVHRWRGLDALPPHLRKFACALVLFARDRKDEATALLDSLSLSFRAPREARSWRLVGRFPFLLPPRRAHPYLMDTRIPEDILGQCRDLLEGDTDIRAAVAPHSVWRETALLALYLRARRMGVLNTALFIWLRPVERRLFYLLNNVGRPVVWTEIAGIQAHYEAECAVARMDADARGLDEPRVEEAVNALEVDLYEEGWIGDGDLSEEVSSNRRDWGLD